MKKASRITPLLAAMAVAVLSLGVDSAFAGALLLRADLSDKTLEVFVDGKSVETYAIGVGTGKHPTPTGKFGIRRLVWNPSWTPPAKKWARGKKSTPPGHPENPMKVVKIYFKEPDYYIHGTAHALSIGEEGSHGCLRMTPPEVADLGKLVMLHGGQQRQEAWYASIMKKKSSTAVRLKTSPVLEVVN